MKIYGYFIHNLEFITIMKIFKHYMKFIIIMKEYVYFKRFNTFITVVPLKMVSKTFLP